MLVVEPASEKLTAFGLGCEAFRHLWTDSNDHIIFTGEDCPGLGVLDVSSGEHVAARDSDVGNLVGT